MEIPAQEESIDSKIERLVKEYIGRTIGEVKERLNTDYVGRRILREKIGLREGQNLPGMLERILYFEEQARRGFWSRPFHRGLSFKCNVFDKIEYIKKRVMDITGKTESELQSNLGAYLERILRASREYEELKGVIHDPPIIGIPYILINNAIKNKITGMKIVRGNTRRGTVVSHRVNDQYEEFTKMPLCMARPLYLRFKIMADVDPAVNSQEQTGITRVRFEDKYYNLEMKFSPSETQRGVTEKLEIEMKEIEIKD